MGSCAFAGNNMKRCADFEGENTMLGDIATLGWAHKRNMLPFIWEARKRQKRREKAIAGLRAHARVAGAVFWRGAAGMAVVW